MTKEKWQGHIEQVTGRMNPDLGGDLQDWKEAVAYHGLMQPDCPDCAARRRTRKTTGARKDREELLREIGLVKGRTGLGRVIWE